MHVNLLLQPKPRCNPESEYYDPFTHFCKPINKNANQNTKDGVNANSNQIRIDTKAKETNTITTSKMNLRPECNKDEKYDKYLNMCVKVDPPNKNPLASPTVKNDLVTKSKVNHLNLILG